MISFVIATMLMVTSLALDPPKEDPDKVSNDQPGRPLQMPPASTEVKEALDDFDRFKRRNAWERALKALYTIPEEQTLRFVDGENGFILPVARSGGRSWVPCPPKDRRLTGSFTTPRRKSFTKKPRVRRS